jgi:ProP effector
MSSRRRQREKEREKWRAILGLLAEQYPRAFTFPPKLLKVGIRDDLITAVGGSLAKRDVVGALKIYCHSVSYVKLQVEGAVRVDLDGSPSGAVTADEAAAAREDLSRRGASWKEKKLAAEWQRAWAKRAAQKKEVGPAQAKRAARSAQGVKPKREVVVERKRRGGIRSWCTEK